MLKSQGLVRQLIDGSYKIFRPDETTASSNSQSSTSSRKRELEVDSDDSIIDSFESDMETVMTNADSTSSVPSPPQRKKAKATEEDRMRLK